MLDVISFRVTRSFNELTKFVDEMASVCECLVVYEHNEPNKRVHIHGYAEKCTVGTDTLKNWIKKTLNVKVFSRSDWAFPEVIEKGPKKGKPVDRESLIYFHKGKYPLLFNKGFDEQFVQEQHAKSYTPTEYVGKSIKTQYKLVCENPTQKKHRENDLVKMMIDKCKDLKTDREVMIQVMEVLNETKTVCGDYKTLDYFDTVMRRIYKGTSLERLMGLLEKRKPRL